MSILDRLLDLLAPHDCVACGLEGSLLCEQHQQALRPPRATCYQCDRRPDQGGLCLECRPKAPLDDLWQAAAYEGYARSLVHRLKYGRAQAAASLMASYMAQQVPQSVPWVVTYAPTTAARIRQRGYDQAGLLAAHLARRLDYPSLSMLRRTTQDHQVGQSGARRRQQMHDAFAVRQASVVQNTDILLVDDVITTGATLDAAAQALRDAGARRVEAVVFARA